ncbi:nitroreductase family protein [Micromonospora tarensis]|uniref:Nitroreductase family protein n=1 Tax=Micromonospora tarensis TaxID=2806100 RepID=A0ABS1YP43_9ACTN|nr:nitroreductase family protein [Micromonospora tarensis]MBM0279219.1 nitroreductase family protein [Micromonospora tarensis]
MTAPSTPDLLALDRAAQDLLFRAARTANTFTAEPVTDAQVAAIHDLIRYGPTAYNGQPLRVLLLRSAAARARLLPYVSSSNRAKTASAPLVTVLAAAEVTREFFPDGRHEALLLLNLGHPGPDAWPERLPRLTVEEVVRTL